MTWRQVPCLLWFSAQRQGPGQDGVDWAGRRQRRQRGDREDLCLRPTLSRAGQVGKGGPRAGSPQAGRKAESEEVVSEEERETGAGLPDTGKFSWRSPGPVPSGRKAAGLECGSCGGLPRHAWEIHRAGFKDLPPPQALARSPRMAGSTCPPLAETPLLPTGHAAPTPAIITHPDPPASSCTFPVDLTPLQTQK